MLRGVRWSLAYPLSPRHVEELMAERGGEVEHAPRHRGVSQESPLLDAAWHRRQRPGWMSWHLDETDIKVKGVWPSLSRAVDQEGKTIDFFLTAPRDAQAAKRFWTKALRRHGGVPETSTIAGRAAHAAAMKRDTEAHGPGSGMRKTQ